MNLVDADGWDAFQVAAGQPPFYEPFTERCNGSQLVWKARRLPPRQIPCPPGQNVHHRRSNEVVSGARGNVLDHYAEIEAFEHVLQWTSAAGR